MAAPFFRGRTAHKDRTRANHERFICDDPDCHRLEPIVQYLSESSSGFVPDPNFKRTILKLNGYRYETINPWYVAFFTDLAPAEGTVTLYVFRIRCCSWGPQVIPGCGTGSVMQSDEALEFCLRHGYLKPVVGHKLTLTEKVKIMWSLRTLFFVGALLVPD